MTKKHNKNYHWFLIGLFAAVMAAPNGTIIKYIISDTSPFVFNACRFGLMALVTTPYILRSRKKINSKNFTSALVVGIFMLMAVMSYVAAIKTSQASYVSILTLLTPIVFVLMSVRITGEKISRRAVAGITLAAIGAFIIVALPIAFKQDASFHFYPLATFFGFCNVLFFPLAIIYSKKANDNGLPLTTIMGISAWSIFVVTALVSTVMGSWSSTTFNTSYLLAIIYSGLVVAFLARVLGVASYEHLGSPVISGLSYLETLLAIIIPVAVLGEQLSIEMVIGGALILLGVYFVEHHKSVHHKHYQLFKSH